MTNRVETRVVITLTNGMSGPLGNMNKSVADFNSRLLSMDNSLKNINRSATSHINTLAKLSGAYKAIGTLTNAFNSAFGGFFDYYKSFQTNAVGISGILSSMATLNGKTLEWNQSMAISKDIMSKLRVQALQTAATSEDLIETFRALLGPGMASKMSIDEIMKFTTVGVNAVKSLGLPTNQLIQELRDLVQGGIRAASSTLATALGLTDADINAAKQSSEGLFKFLMKRMEGFTKSTGETANTIYGQMEIAKEAIKSIGAEAGTDIFEGFSSALKSINDVLLARNGESGLLEVNPEVIENVKMITNAIKSAIDFGVEFGKQIGASFDTVWKTVGAMYVVPKLAEMMSSAFMRITNRVATIREITREAASEARIQAAEQVTLKERQLAQEERIAKLQKQSQDALNKAGFGGKFLQHYIEQYEKLGYTTEQAYRKMLKFANIMNGTDALAQKNAKAILQEVNAQVRNAEATERASKAKRDYAGIISKSIGVMGQFSGALSSVAFGLMAVSDADNEFSRQLSESLLAMDAVITGLNGVNEAIKVSITWWKSLSVTVRATALSLLAAVPLALGAAAAIYSASQGGGKTNTETGDGNDISDMVEFNPDGTFKSVKSNKDIMNAAEIDKNVQKKAELQGEINRWKKIAEEAKSNLDDDNYIGKLNGLATKFTKEAKDKSGGGKSDAEKAAEQLEKAIKKYESLQDKLNVDIKKSSLMYSVLDEKSAVILKQENAWAEEIKALAEKGVDANKIKELTLLKDRAIKERQIAAQREYNEKINQLSLESAQNVMLLGGNQSEQKNAIDEALRDQLSYYDGILKIEGLAYDKRIEYEKKRAEVVKQIRDNDMLDYKTAWKATLQELATQQINYGDSIKNAFSTIESASVNLLTSTESFGKRIKTFFSDIASSIMAEMAKLIIRGLITNAILSFFNKGSQINSSAKNSVLGSYSKAFADMNKAGGPTFGMDQYIQSRAVGGLANGWTVVGEQGPELVNFSQPGRVYTAEQTRNALGGGQAVNIKIDLRNESGQQLEAQQSGTTFDGENYVLGIVLKAISTNKNGIRTIMKGVAQA